MGEQKAADQVLEACAPATGTACLTYDAGGSATSVNPNPIQALYDAETNQGMVTWKLSTILNAAPGWSVRLSNAIRCDPSDLPYGFQSQPSPDGKSWTWTWSPQLNEPPRLVRYDLFFVYAPDSSSSPDPGGGARMSKTIPSTLIQVVSLREILAVDPSILLPPEPMSPPGSGEGGGGGRRTREG